MDVWTPSPEIMNHCSSLCFGLCWVWINCHISLKFFSYSFEKNDIVGNISQFFTSFKVSLKNGCKLFFVSLFMSFGSNLVRLNFYKPWLILLKQLWSWHYMPILGSRGGFCLRELLSVGALSEGAFVVYSLLNFLSYFLHVLSTPRTYQRGWW